MLSYPKDARRAPRPVHPFFLWFSMQPCNRHKAGSWVHGDHPAGGVAELRGCREAEKGADGLDG